LEVLVEMVDAAFDLLGAEAVFDVLASDDLSDPPRPNQPPWALVARPPARRAPAAMIAAIALSLMA
jgi:hypothetical protein